MAGLQPNWNGNALDQKQQEYRRSYTTQSTTSKTNDSRSRRKSSNTTAPVTNQPYLSLPSHEPLGHMYMQPNPLLGQQPGAAVPQNHSGFMPWHSYNMSANQTSLLADAYGAANGQPQPGTTTSLDWVNGMSAYMLMDPSARPSSFSSPMVQQTPSNINVYQPSPSQLTQYMSQLQFQNQQQENIAMQQNLFLSQIQHAQEQRAQQAIQDQITLRQQRMSPSQDSALDSNARLRTDILSARSREAHSQHLHNGPLKEATFVSSRIPDVLSKRYSGHSNVGTPSKDSILPFQSDHDAYEDACPSPSVEQSARLESKRVSSKLSKEETGDISSERRRSLTPSIVIDQVNIESTDHDLARKVNSVGMRMGPRTATIMHEVQVPENNTKSKNGKEGLRRSLVQDGNRLGNGHSALSLPLIQPRRQPRGPPMDAFFANNFLARRSLRTRREAMSKLCASPRASIFQNLRSIRTSSPAKKTPDVE